MKPETPKQRGRIPGVFRETMRLDEFIRITDGWEQVDDRRCQLIEKRLQNGCRTATEDKEFGKLQRLYGLRRSYLRWQRTGDANSPLLDEAALGRLLQKHGLEIPDDCECRDAGVKPIRRRTPMVKSDNLPEPNNRKPSSGHDLQKRSLQKKEP